jgi:tetratricopeptide (TPR) repeat protein
MHRPQQLALFLALAACTSTAENAPPSAPAPASARPVEAAAPVTSTAVWPAAPAAEAAPDSPEHAAVLELLRDPDQAHRFAQSWLSESDVEPKVGAPEGEAYQQIVQAIAAEDTALALQLLAAQRGPSGNALFDFMEGNLRYQGEEHELAVAAYREAVLKHPRFRRAWGNLALASARSGDFEGAIEGFSRVVALGGADATTYALLGIAHSNRRDYLAAESAFRMATLLDPASLEWRMGLAECLFKQERFDDAVALCASLLRTQPERAELWLLQANAYARLGRPLDAAENLEVLHGLGRGTAETFNLLGDIYVNERLFELSRDNYASALELAPEAGAARAVRAAGDLAARGALEESRALIERVESAAGASLDEAQRMQVLKLRARIAVASGAGDEQVRILEEIVALDPLDGEALLLLGQHYGRSGDP